MANADFSGACESVYKKLLNDYADGQFKDVVVTVDDICKVCSMLLHYSSDEFKAKELVNLFFEGLGFDRSDLDESDNEGQDTQGSG